MAAVDDNLGPPSSSYVQFFAWPAIAAALAAMLWWTWGRGTDVLVDFGREVYVPWQLAEGKVLYRDVACVNGPLSPYVNSLWFRIAGSSIAMLAVANAAVLAIACWLVHRIVDRIAGVGAAFVACLLLVLMFAFGSYEYLANYNFIYPYSHELTHGVVLSLAAVYCFARFQDGGRLLFVALSGLLVGLAFLTKPEIFVGIAAALAVGLPIALVFQSNWRERGLTCGAFLAGALVGPILAWILLATAMPAVDAVHAVLGGIPYLFNRRLTALPYFERAMGTADLSQSLQAIGLWSGGYLLLFGSAVALGIGTRRLGTWAWLACVPLLAVPIGLALWSYETFVFGVLLPLPVLLLAAGIWRATGLVRHRRDLDQKRRAVVELTLIALSLALLLKILLNVRVTHYGFALALPGAMVAVAILLDWLPLLARRSGGSGTPVQLVGLAAIVALVVGCLMLDAKWLGTRTVQVGEGHNAVWAPEDVGPAVNEILDEIARFTKPTQTLAVVPEGALVNFLSGRANPTPYINILPAEVVMLGDEKIAAALAASPPDFIVLAPRDTSEYGFRGLGQDYGQKISAWIDGNYEVFERPPRDGQYHLTLLIRNR